MDNQTQKTELEKELREIDAQIGRLERQRFVRISLLGIQGSCKSSLLAAWYMFRTNPELGIDLDFYDRASDQYLNERVKELLETGSTGRTPMAHPDIIKFRIKTGNEVWNVETMDYAGEMSVFVPNPQKPDPQTPKLVERFLQFLRGSDVVVYLFCWNEESRDRQRPLACMDAIDLSLGEDKPDDSWEDKPCVMLAVAKFDELCAKLGASCPKTREELEQIITALEERNPLFRTLRWRLKNRFRNSGMFHTVPVSPLGADFSKLPDEEYPLHRERFRPFNIYACLLLTIERRKHKQAALCKRRSEVQAELDRLEAALQHAKHAQDAAKEQEVRTARCQLEELKRAFASRLDTAGGLTNEVVAEWTRVTSKIEQVADLHQDVPLADKAAQFREDVKKEVKRRTRYADLANRLGAIEEEVEHAHGGEPVSWLAWLVAPSWKWRAELARIEREATTLGFPDLAARSRELISQIRMRGIIIGWLVGLGLAAALVLGILYLVYLLRTPL